MDEEHDPARNAPTHNPTLFRHSQSTNHTQEGSETECDDENQNTECKDWVEPLTSKGLHFLCKSSNQNETHPHQNLIAGAECNLPLSLLNKNDFPLPHLAKRPTVMGMLREGSLSMSAKALL
jgi:hypothetical protein